LAIDWVNSATNNFANFFDDHDDDAILATQIVQRAVDDWSRVTTDFNYDNDSNPTTDNTFSLTGR
jgi:hypothetical protein